MSRFTNPRIQWLAASGFALTFLIGSGAAARAGALHALAQGNESVEQQDTQVVVLPAPPPSAGGQKPEAASQTAPLATSIEARASARVRNGLMWKATWGKNTAYLLGSIHLATADIYPLPAQIEDAFQRSSVLLVEIDLQKLDPGKFLPLISSSGMYPPGDALWNHVSANTRELVTRFCGTHGLYPEQLSQFKLWMAAVMLSAAEMQSFGLHPELGIDQHFLSEAKDGKRVEELESPEQQIRILASLPEPAEEKDLDEMLQDPQRIKDTLDKLQTAWIAGDAGMIDKIVSTEMGSFPGEEKIMLSDRNPHMTDGVERYLKSGETCFLVVGAGHLVGKGGIVQLLKQRGFKVEQVLSAK